MVSQQACRAVRNARGRHLLRLDIVLDASVAVAQGPDDELLAVLTVHCEDGFGELLVLFRVDQLAWGGRVGGLVRAWGQVLVFTVTCQTTVMTTDD